MPTRNRSADPYHVAGMIFAVHIADGVLTLPWIVAGFAIAFAIVGLASWKVTDREIPVIGLTAAAVFVGSQLHIPLGVSSVHLLLNGIAGLALGRRAPLAIAVGLALQTLFFAHGGKLAYGVNCCVLALPALLTVVVAPIVDRIRSRKMQSILVFVAIAIWLVIMLTSVQMLVWKWQSRSPREWLESPGEMWVLHPIPVIVIVIVSIAGTWRIPARFANGVLLGGMCATMTVFLNLLAVRYGGVDGIRTAAVVTLLAHWPVVAIEALAFAVIRPYVHNSNR